MRAIYKIARLELSNLFYSPVAWLLLILFVFVTGMALPKCWKDWPDNKNLVVMVCMRSPKNYFILPQGAFGLKSRNSSIY